MKKVFITVHVKNFFLLVIAFIGFIVITSVLIVGLGNNETINKNKNAVIKSEENKNIVKFDSLPKVTKIKVLMTKTNTIKELNLEVYVTGVVASEMPAEFKVEALKAQAVAARTYALAHVKEVGGSPYKNGKGADVCDTVQCQVYKNKDECIKVWGEDKGQEYWNKINSAVEATSGQVLTYNNQLVMEPYYFAISSGKTENSEDVFSNSIPYLKSVDSPGEEKAKNANSSKSFKYKELSKIINNNYNSANVTSSNIRNQIAVVNRTQAGSVKNIKVGSITMTGSKFRTMLDLKSSNFKINFKLNGIELDCSGYGHDVGMSQNGANVMAKVGKSYVDILTHYYQGTAISK